MIKSKSEKSQKIEIDLTGSDGNAFALLGHAKRWAKQLGFDGDEIAREMMSSDYDNLVETLDKYFGEFVTLYR